MGKTLSHNFGTDPEAFVYQELVQTQYGNIPEIIPPAALVEDFGMKTVQVKDKKVLTSGFGFQWSEDGAAIEMQIEPQNTVRNFFTTVNRGINHLQQFLRPFGLNVWTKPLGHFDTKKYWENRGEDFQLCVVFGCDPDEFPMQYFELGLEGKDHTEELDVSSHEFRYAGAHVHIQAPIVSPSIYFDKWDTTAICFDFFVGMLNTTFRRKPEILTYEKARLEYYGKPGRIRLQIYNHKENVYGIEYRVMSNHWMRNFPMTRALLYSMDLAATIAEREGERFVEDKHKLISDMYSALVNMDQESAGKIYKKSMAWALEHGFVKMDELKALNITMQEGMF
jgi:hypothetical protein